MQAKLGQIPVNVTLSIELFILVIHFNRFLRVCNVNSCLKLKHDLFSQIPVLRYSFCQVNQLFETQYIKCKYQEVEYSEQRASNEIH